MARTRSPLAKKIAATSMVAIIIGIIALAAAQFLDYFADTDTVTLDADRAGLVMNPQAKVRMRGVTVGHVGKITSTGQGVRLRLDIDADQMHLIPADVRAIIRSNTVFGAKSVDFLPGTSGGPALSAGAHLGTDRVQVELTTLYQQLVDVLAQIHPEKLNTVLGTLDTALSGRGDRLGDGLVELSQLLGKVNPHLDALNDDFRLGATVTNTYADVGQRLMRIVDNATDLGNTLRTNASDLDALLVNATGMADTINGILAPNKSTIIAMLSDLNPTARLLGYQSPGIACFFTATAAAAKKAEGVFGLTTGYLSLNAGLLPGKDPYRYPQDLPEVAADGPPTCADGLGNPSSRAHTPFYVSDNAPQPYQPRTTPKFSANKLFQVLFGTATSNPSGPGVTQGGGR